MQYFVGTSRFQLFEHSIGCRCITAKKNYGRIILLHRITNCSMTVDISPVLFQASSPTPTPVDNGTWFLIVIYPVVIVAVVATFSGLLWHASDDGWEVTPRSAVGIPSAAILALAVTYLIFHGLEVPLYESALFWVAVATLHGAGAVGGAAFKQRRWEYLAVVGLVTTLGLFLSPPVSSSQMFALEIPFAVVLGFGIGYVTG